MFGLTNLVLKIEQTVAVIYATEAVANWSFSTSPPSLSSFFFFFSAGRKGQDASFDVTAIKGIIFGLRENSVVCYHQLLSASLLWSEVGIYRTKALVRCRIKLEFSLHRNFILRK